MKRWVTLSLAALGTLLVLAVLALVLVPQLLAASNTRVSDGSEAFAIGLTAQVTPAAGWSVGPEPDGSVVVRSPDRQLDVVLVAESSASAGQNGDEHAHLSALLLANGVDEAALRSEVLADGAELRHVMVPLEVAGEGAGVDGADVTSSEPPSAGGAALIGELRRDGVTVVFEATTEHPTHLSTYHAEIAELLLQISGAPFGTSS